MKRLLLLLLTLSLFLPTRLFARDFEYTYEGQTLTYTVTDEEAKTCKVTKAIYKYSGDIILPSKPKDNEVEYTLTEVGSFSFSMCYNLKSIIIPNSVETIGQCAFYLCDNLTYISVGDGVRLIDTDAFYNCSRLEMVDFASIESLCKIKFETFDDNPLYITHRLFINGEEVKDLVIPVS